jgi:type 1 glutamine amidotransferase
MAPRLADDAGLGYRGAMRARTRIAARTAWLLPIAVALVGIDAHADARVLVFSKTTGYRHASIPSAIAALELLAPEQGWVVTATEDAAVFTDGTLGETDVAVFLMNTGDVLDEAQQAGLQSFVEAGHGFVGIHSVSNAETEFPWFGELLATRFADHPAQQDAIVRVVDATHPACVGLPEAWMRFDEWYNFTSNPSASVDVLLRVDESSYQGGTMGRDHPIAWTHVLSGARVFYTAGGHTPETWSDPLWLGHITGGMQWVVEGEPPAGGSDSGGEASSDSGADDGTTAAQASSGVASGDSSGSAATTIVPGSEAAAGSSSGSTDAEAVSEPTSGCGCRQPRGAGWLGLLLPLVRRRGRRRDAAIRASIGACEVVDAPAVAVVGVRIRL